MWLEQVLRVVLILVILQLEQCSGMKIVDDAVYLHFLRLEPWKVIARHSFEKQGGKFKIKLRFQRIADLQTSQIDVPIRLHVYSAKKWLKTYEEEKFCDRMSHSEKNFSLTIPARDEWSKTITYKLRQTEGPETYFIAISDCENKVREIKSPGNKIEYYIEFDNKDELASPEHYGLIEANYFFILVSGILLIMNLVFLRNSVKRDSFDWGHFFIVIVLLLDIFSYCCELYHMSHGSSYILKSWIVDYFGLVSNINASFIKICIYCLISRGWTIKIDSLSGYDTFIMTSFMVGCFQVIFVGVGQATAYIHEKIHDFDNWCGILILFVRICFFFYFVSGQNETVQGMSQGEKNAFKKFILVGSVFFWVLPLLVLASDIFHVHNQHKIVYVGNSAVQLLSTIFLTILFSTSIFKMSIILLKKRELPFETKNKRIQ